MVRCALEEKPLVLVHLVREEVARGGRVLCFTNSKEMAHRLCILLKEMSVVCVDELSSSLSHGRRREALSRLRNGNIDVCTILSPRVVTWCHMTCRCWCARITWPGVWMWMLCHVWWTMTLHVSLGRTYTELDGQLEQGEGALSLPFCQEMRYMLNTSFTGQSALATAAHFPTNYILSQVEMQWA